MTRRDAEAFNTRARRPNQSTRTAWCRRSTGGSWKVNRRSLVRQLLEEKNVEMKAHETKVRLEVKEQLKELHDTKETIQKQIHEYSLLEKSIKEIETSHKKELEALTKVTENLKTEVRWHQDKLAEMAEDERKRSHQLQEAFKTYLKPDVQNENISYSGDVSMHNNIVK